jgi:hypothetical protein
VKDFSMRHRLASAVTICLMATCSLLLSGCGNGPATGDWAGSVIDSAGITIVRNPSTGLWRPGDVPTVTEVLRIGETDGEPAYQFGSISGVNVDAEGRIYVGDNQAREVRVFDESGTYVHTIGRPGSGPGEWSPAGTTVLLGAGDTIFIPDPSHPRVNIFLRDGTFVRSFPLTMTQGVSVRWAVTPGYELLQQVRRIPMPGMDLGSGPDLILRRASDGTIMDTVMTFPTGKSVEFSGGMPKMTIFAPEPWWALAADGRIVFAVSSDYRIEVRNPDGTLESLFEKEFERQPVTEADRKLLLEFLKEAFDRQGMPAQVLQMIVDGTSFADYYPAFSNILSGPGGTVWVRRVLSAKRAVELAASVEEMGSPEWDVFDQDSRYLGVVTLPLRFDPKRFQGNRIYGVAKDELDIPYVVGLELDMKSFGDLN